MHTTIKVNSCTGGFSVNARWTFNEFQYTGVTCHFKNMINVSLYTCFLITLRCRQGARTALRQPAGESSDSLSANTFKCGCFLPRTALKYAYIYISIMESISQMMRALRFLWQRHGKKKKKQQLRGCVTWKLAACSLAALNSELVGVYFWGNPDDLTITPPAAGLMRLIISAGVTQHLSCDLRAPDEEPRENRRGRASAASKKINFLPDTPARALSVSVCYFPCLFYFNASTLPVR